ncbi:hypothetical protein MRX96_043241 [Rhipicephalus microplus]
MKTNGSLQRVSGIQRGMKASRVEPSEAPGDSGRALSRMDGPRRLIPEMRYMAAYGRRALLPASGHPLFFIPPARATVRRCGRRVRQREAETRLEIAFKVSAVSVYVQYHCQL